MKASLSLVSFEVRLALRRVSTWIYAGLYTGLAFLMTILMGGAFTSADAAIGGVGGQIRANAPYPMTVLALALGLFSVPVLAGGFGQAIQRDHENRTAALVYSTPVPVTGLLLSRFAGAAAAGFLLMLGIIGGEALGTVMPFLAPERLGPWVPGTFAWILAFGLLPLLLVCGALFFALATLTRSMLPNYLGGVLLLVGSLVGEELLSDLDHKTLAAFLDPFGENALGLATEYFTPAERNTRLPPLVSLFGASRLAWLILSFTLLALALRRFDVQRVLAERAPRLRPDADAPSAQASGPAPVVRRDTSAAFPALLATWRIGLTTIVRNVYFPGIVGAGLLFLGFAAREAGRTFDTPTWPVTYQVAELLGGAFGPFFAIVIAVYAGELLWQERERNIDQIADALPVSDWPVLLGKLGALASVVLILHAVVFVAGVFTQTMMGFHRYDFSAWLLLLGLSAHAWLLQCVLAFTIHTVVNGKFLGHALVIIVFVGQGFLPGMGFAHPLYRYAADPGLVYSDMNGTGPFAAGVLWYRTYWTFVATLFVLVARALWVRGRDSGLRARARAVRRRMRRADLVVGAGGLGGALATGGFLFWNANVVETWRTPFEAEEVLARYEREFGALRDTPHPRVTDVDVTIELQPAAGTLRFQGRWTLTNRTDAPLSVIHMALPERVEVRSVTLTPPGELEREDKPLGQRLYRLETPLAPGGSAVLEIDAEVPASGIAATGPSTEVVENGSFVNSSSFPTFGYADDAELSDDDTRRKHDLAPKPRMRPIDDPRGLRDNYVARDSDFVRFRARIATDPDQIALAPGRLVREWSEGGRRWFEYEATTPILNFWSVLSARWKLAEDHWNDVAIRVYYDPAHDYNVDRMLQSVKATLTYCTEAFGPYQHREVRILEFPRYASFAQSFPATIPYSESIGFIARIADPEDIDYVFYVTAHEVAHQWFAHQIVSANVQGATVLTESLAQYAALMVMEKEYGPALMRKFLAHELDGYLRGRAFERKRELPLLLQENQAYIHYNKGSLATYALRDVLGESVMNAAVREALDEWRFRGPPYPTSYELRDALLHQASPEHHEFIRDVLERIVVWDLRATSAVVTPTPEGRWSVALEYRATKYLADESGEEQEIPFEGSVDVGVFAEGPSSAKWDDEALYLAKHAIHSGDGKITVVVDREPVRAGVDPLVKLVDRKSADNTVDVEQAPGS